MAVAHFGCGSAALRYQLVALFMNAWLAIQSGVTHFLEICRGWIQERLQLKRPDVKLTSEQGANAIPGQSLSRSDSMADFFRKERAEGFTTRFTPPAPGANYWQLKGPLIFQAKAYPQGRRMSVKVGGQTILVECKVDFNKLTLRKVVNGAPAGATITILESEMLGLIAERSDTAKSDTLKHQSALYLCKNHATSSANSPLISGCNVNNFDKSLTYPGHKLHLELKERTPFQNPYVSGLEKEYFLIGQVKDSDCKVIKYLGKTDEDIDVLVNPFGSQIPRPS
jgi:hypothetical protein